MIASSRSREPVIRTSIITKGYCPHVIIELIRRQGAASRSVKLGPIFFFAGRISGAAMRRIENPPVPGVRPARVQEASELSDLCVRSKAVWGYDETFMALVRAALEVRPEHIDAGDVWVATAADGSIAGIVALGPSDQPGTLDLEKLFVAPQRIRNGVGRMLLAYAMAEARRRGARRLTILSDPYAAAFYECSGAIRIGAAPSDAIPGRMLPLFEIRLAPTP